MALVISTPSAPFVFSYTEPVSGGTDQHFEYDFTISHSDSPILQLTYIKVSVNYDNLDRQGGNPATTELFVKDQVPGGGLDTFSTIDTTHSLVTVGFDLPFDYYDRLGAGEVASIRASMTVNDSNEEESDTVLVYLNITGRNDLPTAVDDAVSVADNIRSLTNSSVLSNDNDVDISDVFAITAVGAPSAAMAGAGTVLPAEYMAQTPGTVSFTATSISVDFNAYYAFLAPGESVSFVVPYTMSDGHGGTSTADVVYTINGTATKTFKGTADSDQMLGEDDNDKMFGKSGDDTLFGRGGKDKIDGDKGDDTIVGGAGADLLTGGVGHDTFKFTSALDSLKKASLRDVILDFKHGADKVDLTDIDAMAGGTVNDAFKWIGTKAFHHNEGELRYEKAGGKVVAYADINGDGKADFSIAFDGLSKLAKGDFDL